MPKDTDMSPGLYPAHGSPEASVARNSEHDGPWTVGRLLTWTADYLKRQGAESPRLDAEVLLSRVLEWERVQLYTHYEDEVSEAPRSQFRELVRRRAKGTPVAYLVGRKEFYSLPLRVTPDVLIPRPDSEFVVVEFLALTKSMESLRAVDVGTGSGCLALACAHQHKSARFVAIDLSPDALAVAEANAIALNLADRIDFRLGNLLEPVADDGLFDVILSNPPYIPTSVIPTLEPGVRLYEPYMALNGGDDGLRVVAPLVAESAARLRPGGHLILEIGTDQELPVRDLIASQGGWDLAPTVRDHANHPRVIRATRRD
jgi:release factor glutamine methyltransferase